MQSSRMKTVLASAALSLTMASGNAFADENPPHIIDIYSDLESAHKLDESDLEQMVRRHFETDFDSLGTQLQESYMLTRILSENVEDIPGLYDVMNEFYAQLDDDYKKSFALGYMINVAVGDSSRSNDVWAFALEAANDSSYPTTRLVAYGGIPYLAANDRARLSEGYELLSESLQNYDLLFSIRTRSADGLSVLARGNDDLRQRVWVALIQQANIDVQIMKDQYDTGYKNSEVVLNAIGQMGAYFPERREEAWNMLVENILSEDVSALALSGMEEIVIHDANYAREVLESGLLDNLIDALDEVEFGYRDASSSLGIAALRVNSQAAAVNRELAEEFVPVLRRQIIERIAITNDASISSVYTKFLDFLNEVELRYTGTPQPSIQAPIEPN